MSVTKFMPAPRAECAYYAVARGFARAANESHYEILACAIMPEHVHMVVRRHANKAEKMIGHFKTRATQQLASEGLHPFQSHRREDGTLPMMWTARGWKVFLDSLEDEQRAIKYVEANPEKEGRPRHSWDYVARSC